MDPEPTTSAGNVAHTGSRSKRAFALHFLEMILVMLVGMGIFSGLSAIGFAAAGSSMSDQPGGAQVMLMGVNMTLPMVLWMGLRGHPAMRNAEMAAAMLVPSFLAALLVWGDALGTMAGLTIQHSVMVPAMLGVMLWRYDEYARPHHGHHG
jgi:hypothetical protein